MNTWVDISQGNRGMADLDEDGDIDDVKNINGYGTLFWFDEKAGRLFLRYRYLVPRFNSFCISYRYGSTEPVPAAIKRACNLMVAMNVMTMDFYSVKVGMGGDIGGLRDQAMQRWEAEINRIISAYQRTGSIHSLYR